MRSHQILAVALLLGGFSSLGAARASGAGNPPGRTPESLDNAATATRAAETEATREYLYLRVRDRAAMIGRRDRSRVEQSIEKTLTEVNREAASRPAPVLARIASEFGLALDQPASLRDTRGASVADVLAACTIAAQDSRLDAKEVLELHDDGLGWSSIAFALGYDLQDFVRAIRVEARVALGREAPDGRVAEIEIHSPAAMLD